MYWSHLSARELQLMQGRQVVLPGDPEPLWLTRGVQLEQALAAKRADARSAAEAESERRSLLERIRWVFHRA